MQHSLSNNIKIYPWYQAATGFLPWMPVFFLFFSDIVSLTQAIELGAIYYLSVVVFEIPSGYLSDRIGRRTTLITAACFAICAYLVYLVASSFEVLAVGQILLAGAIAFQSGSDNSILYDSLMELDQHDDYADHEAKSQQYSMMSLCISVLLGGLLGTISLRLPYLAALFAGFIVFYLGFSFKEPSRIDHSVTRDFLPQLLATVKLMANPVLCWVLVFYVVGYGLQHVPYEFYQPYISLLNTGTPNGYFSNSHPAIVSGIVIGLSMFGGALAATASVKLANRFGALTVLNSTILVQCLIIAGLGLWLHPALLVLILFRNFSMAVAHAPMHALIAPRVSSGIRATYLSVQSLAGRLLFSLSLFLIASNTDQTQALEWTTLSPILRTYALIGFIALLALVVSARLKQALFKEH